MLFKHFYTWIKYKTLPPSLLFKNRLFVEKDSKKLRVFNNLGLTFRNERWTNWESSHVDWRWIDLFILMTRYLAGFGFIVFIWYFWDEFFVEIPFFNKVAYRFWLTLDFFNYYSLYWVWLLILIRSFIWDTFVVVFFSGVARQYHPLARREESARQTENQMETVIKEIRTSLPPSLLQTQNLIWFIVSQSNKSTLSKTLTTQKFNSDSMFWMGKIQSIYKINFLANNISFSNEFKNQLKIVLNDNINYNIKFLHLQTWNNSPFLSTQIQNFNLMPCFQQMSFKNTENQFSTVKKPLLKFVAPFFTKLNIDLSNLAKEKRLFQNSLLSAPSASIQSLKLNYVKTHIYEKNIWNVPPKTNIWFKLNAHIDYHSIFNQINSFENLQSNPNFKFSSKFTKIDTNQKLNVSLDSFEWLIQRSFISKNTTYKFLFLKNDGNTQKKNNRKFIQLNTIRNLNQIVNVSNSSLFPNIHPKSSKFHIKKFNIVLNTSWILWSEEKTQIFKVLYLNCLSTYYPLSLGNKKTYNIKFRL